jgi:hypothetical protein
MGTTGGSMVALAMVVGVEEWKLGVCLSSRCRTRTSLYSTSAASRHVPETGLGRVP